MDIERYCTVCKDEAPMFCRMCSMHYCPDHLCLHLNVAWENNTYTKRNNNDNQGSECIHTTISMVGDEYHENTEPAISNTPKSILSYTEAELQVQYNFYLSQARRIRVELERRCIPLSGASESGQKRKVSWDKPQHNQRKPRSTVPKSATYAVELLLDRLRQGTLSVENIQQGIAVAQMRAVKKNS